MLCKKNFTTPSPILKRSRLFEREPIYISLYTYIYLNIAGFYKQFLYFLSYYNLK